jgi:excisionase family DNA binding protein
MSANDNRLLTYAEVAAWFSMAPSSVRALVRQGKLAHIRIGPQTVRFERAVCEQFLEERKAK